MERPLRNVMEWSAIRMNSPIGRLAWAIGVWLRASRAQFDQ